MSKRRKYDVKNKRNIIIIGVVAVVIVCIFSLFIYKYSKASKIEYKIEAGSVLQDVLKNYITLDDDAVLKIRWNGNYYLEYNKEKINLGKKVIAYNGLTGSMKLYGTFYEIDNDGKIIENKNETVLANTTDSKFYKIDDREYLLVDTKIYSNDNSIQADNYLLVELDKAGNAKLSNDKINLKTISPTILVTSEYTFDIANEILNYGQYDIDLKKIIGSTNQYNPTGKGENSSENQDDNADGSSGTGSGTGTGTGDGTGSGNGTGGGSGGVGTGTGTEDGANTGIGVGGSGVGPGDVVNNDDIGNVPDIGEIMDKVKMTSIIRVVEGLNQIDVDYVIYDPYNEYKTVYVEVVSSGKVDVIYLSKNDTHITLNNLVANTNYKLNFVYTTIEKNEETGQEKLVPYTFEQFDLKTKMPEYSISIYKLSRVYNTLTYKVNLQSGFNISKVNVELLFDYEEETIILNSSVDVNDLNSDYVLGNFDMSNYSVNEDTLLKLKIKSVISGGVELPINSTYTFRFGR